MKKLLTLLFFILTSMTAFSQNVFLRANTFNIGYRGEEGTEIKWSEPTSVNILIKVEENKATIFSKDIQIYRLISTTEKREEYTKYYCTNDEGNNCYILIFTLPESPGSVFFAIEFSDYVWYYITKPE
jgi:hypothetical protein